ncbi:MAG: glycosyltransferase, partial [Proteobacteria bacterium]
WLDREVLEARYVAVSIDGEQAVELRLDEPVPPGLWRFPTPPSGRMRGFAGDIVLPAAPPGSRHAVVFTAIFAKGGDSSTLVIPVERVEPQKADPQLRGQSPRIAICMAVYNPEKAAFTRQFNSIVGQNREDWICIVNDDGSDSEHRAVIETVIGGDPRFYCFRNERNLGFYGNFETTLSRVPEGVEYVALSDQDDAWYPDKLERLVDALGDDALLSYSDMRLVDEDGGEIAPSYWGYRRNAFEDLDLMLVANTVTGAASMIRRELLDALLPFPPRIGDAFHDHWIACSALARGRIAYVDRPLYDYFQHRDNVIGHCGFDSRVDRKIRYGNLLQLLNPINARSMLGRFTGAGQAVYWHECRRIESVCANILVRSGVAAGKERKLRAYGRGLRSTMALLGLNLKHRDSARLTNNAERRLAHGYVVHSALSALGRLH